MRTSATTGSVADLSDNKGIDIQFQDLRENRWSAG